jgi:hypothetical protein
MGAYDSRLHGKLPVPPTLIAQAAHIKLPKSWTVNCLSHRR